MSMHVIIETPRLLLREFNPGDADLIYTLNEDPEITRYTLDPVRDRAHAQDILDTVILPQYSLYRYGRWAVHIRENLEFIGWCGLKFRPEPGETDLGYRFMKKAWGKGYATEAAHACLQFGFRERELSLIVGRALPANLASLRVLEKCGMTYMGEEIVEGLLHKIYHARNPLIPS